ncbi:MAG: topoisomerase DNA-binding C4 zinc finger domain-containing protein [Candidatus Woesearchaeota archaeon]|nr:MAG: topoisomerase DNA-binding C4 zinc finger domain-containing protein [Candidatus Woesearchaeota archaeon]
MTYELIISEKPQAAQKIAFALGSAEKKRKNSVNYFSVKYKDKDIVVASAVGHLYGLGEKGGESWKYPVFDTEWKPTYKTQKAASYTKDYIKLLEELGKDADEVTIASDFDVEGEVIGLNVMRFALGRKDANRMKFSTLTKGDLIKAYDNKQNHIEWGQAKAGETRHTLDWYYGINLSRAFTESIRKGTRQFKVLSTGRVQAPALHFLAERERAIEAFVPEDYTELYLHGNCRSTDIKAQYIQDSKALEAQKTEEEEDDVSDDEQKIKSKAHSDKTKIFDKEFAEKVYTETKGKDGVIKEIGSKRFNQAVPLPFDLTSLQMEASTLLGFSPKRTLETAQKLYIEGVTSYPRTSSQQLPKELNLKGILEKLAKQPNFKDKVAKVLSLNPSVKPVEGKKSDPAHPAIHPTGELPTKMDNDMIKLYDLVAKRFFAIFGKPALRETNTIAIDVNSHTFIMKGTRTVEKNWHELYEPYVKLEDIELPKLEKGDAVKNKKIEKLEKKTSPPKRYTDASIIKELEKRSLGTKATRAEILQNLKDRAYIVDKSIKVTELGMKMDEILSEEVPVLVDEQLTRHFEEEMEEIREGKKEPQKILDEARAKLQVLLDEVRKKEVELGKKLAGANYEAQREMEKLGPCPKCKTGTIIVRRAKVSKKRFAGCDGYPNCNNIYPLPQAGKIVKTETVDSETGAPIIILLREGKRPWRLCIDPQSSMNKRNEQASAQEGEEPAPDTSAS